MPLARLDPAAPSRKDEQYAIKNFITKQEERARAAHGFFQRVQPRTCIFIGSFNIAPGSGELIEYLNTGDQRR